MPKRFYDISEEDRKFAQAAFDCDNDMWVHTTSVMVLIAELVRLIPNRHLNREKLSARLLQVSLRANQKVQCGSAREFRAPKSLGVLSPFKSIPFPVLSTYHCRLRFPTFPWLRKASILV